MVRTALASGQDADALIFVIEASSPLVDEDRQTFEFFKESKGIPFLAINKIDLVKRKTLLPIIDQYQRLQPFHRIIPISAVTGEGVEILLSEVLKVLPEGKPYFPEEMITDQTERFLVAEIIREKVIQQSYQEIPYSTAVTIEAFKEQPERDLVVIQGTIHVERDSQKKILIGKKGQKLRKIGETARKEIEAFLERRVFLELWVSVEKDWTRDPRSLDRLGY
jgi:GTP-binding protein Era